MKLYSAVWCKYCVPIKELIQENNYDIEILDVDEIGRDNVKARGVKQLPTLELDDGSLMTESEVITNFIKENF